MHSLSHKGSYCTSSHSFLSHTCSFSLSSSQIASYLTVTIYGSIMLQALSIFSLSLSLSIPTLLFSSLSLPLEHLISLWSTVSLHPSLPPCVPRFSRLPHHRFRCRYCLPHPLSFSFSLWSALRVLFIQPQPTQSGAEQNRAVKGVWLAKVGITSETQQNSSLFYSICANTTLFLSLRHITTLLSRCAQNV